MFETVKLGENYLDLFAHLDPYNFLEYGKLKDRVCLGTVLKGEGKDMDKPVGLLICRLTGSALVTEWIFVEGAYRMQGIGAQLMKCVFEEAKKRGIDKVYSYLALGNKRDKICPGEVRLMEEYNLKMLKPGKNTKGLYDELVPGEFMGCYLYVADVESYFSKMQEKSETADLYVLNEEM